MNTTDTASRGWESLLNESADYWRKATENKREASKFLWLGAKAAIRTWGANEMNDDLMGEYLYRATLIALGGTRKGSASKIKTVALATKLYGLDIDAYGSLNAAYLEAQRLALGTETTPDPVCCACACHNHKGQ